MTELTQDLDTGALETYLGGELGADVTGIEVLHDGLNLVVAVETAAEGYVLRRPRKLRDAAYMNDIEREYGVLRRLRDTAVPAPDPVLFCADESVLGDRFYVMTRLDGEVVPLGSPLPDRFRDPVLRARFADVVVDTLAAVHSVDPDPFGEVCERVTPREQVRREIARLDAVTAVTGREVPTLRAVGDWLLANAPPLTEAALVHGDYRPGNVVFAPGQRPEVVGVLDWETAMLGDPRTELGYLLLRWRDEGDPTPDVDEIAARHPEDGAVEYLRECNENGLAPFTAEAGSPTRREVVARYEGRTGRTFEHDRFYRAKAAFGLALVWEDLDRYRVEAGSETELAPHVDYVAAMAERIVDGEFPL
jgi:aminoglycoside phosphotransferase (APT) family kinase protein